MIPKSVEGCHNNGGRALSFWTHRKSDPSKWTRQVYKCRNWRCTGNDAECAAFDRKLLYARITEAIRRDGLSPDGWFFAVFTLDREGTFSGEKRWRDADEAYRALSRISRRFKEKLRKWQKKNGMRPLGREWVETIEAHRTGWPHANLLGWSPELAEYIEREQKVMGPEWKRLGFNVATLPPELMTLARAAHYGTLSTIDRARSTEKIVNYIAKIAGEAGQAMNEIAKLTQLPRNAPTHFRRVRSGKGWLPKRKKNPEITGSLLVRKRDKQDGSIVVVPVNNITDPVLRERMAGVCYLETQLADHERENYPALRQALAAANHLPAIPESASPEFMAEFVAAQKAARGEAHRKFGTPLILTVIIPHKVAPVELNWPEARAGPDPDPEPELDFFSD